MKIVNLNVYQNDTKSFVLGEVLIKDGLIMAIGEDLPFDEEVFDANGAYAIPGLIDVHTHGIAGYDFVSAKGAELEVMAKSYAKHGVTTVMPTLASAPLEDMLLSVKDLNSFTPSPDAAELYGVHIEGRYLNPAKRGAHAKELLAPLSACELDNDILRSCRALHISAAFELDLDGSFAKKACEIGATLGLGHTEANYTEAKLAQERGITSYTHLFNAMPPLHHRDGGAVCAALEGDRFAELICDGIHVSREMVRLAYRAKGANRFSLISDSMSATDCADGEYSIAGEPVTVKDGIARTHGGALAGSTLTLERAVNNLCDFCGIPLAEAVLCATETPARQMGIFDVCGSIEVGKKADMVIIKNDRRIDIDRVMIRGKWMDL